MTPVLIMATLMALGLMAYLIFALLRPESFQ